MSSTYQSDCRKSTAHLIRIGKNIQLCAGVDDVVDDLLVCYGAILKEDHYVFDHRGAKGAGDDVFTIFGVKLGIIQFFW